MAEELSPEVELALKRTAADSMGIYPQSINGVPRTDWQDGWNEALIALSRKESRFEKWYHELDSRAQQVVGRMLAADAIFLMEDENDNVRICYDSSDLFAWGYSACEFIEDNEQLRGVHEAWKEHPEWGIKKRLCKLENQKPQGPVEKLMREAGAWDGEMDALPPNQYDKGERDGRDNS